MKSKILRVFNIIMLCLTLNLVTGCLEGEEFFGGKIVPQVASLSPAYDTVDVSQNEPIVITLNTDLNEFKIGVVEIASPALTFTEDEISISKNKITITPAGGLTEGVYRGITVKDFVGKNDKTMKSFTDSDYTFTVGGASRLLVSSTDPLNGESNIAVDKTIKINFSSEVSNKNVGIVSISPGITLQQSWNGNTLELSHSADFDNNQQYSVSISGFESDGLDAMTPYSFSFQTKNNIIPDKLAVTGSEPLSGASSVAVNKTIKVTFSGAVSNPNDGYVSVNPAVNLNKAWNGNTLELSHSSDFSYDTNYSITIYGYKGYNLDEMNAHTISFKTEVQGQLPKLNVVSTDPSTGSSNVATDKVIKVTFDNYVSNQNGGSVTISPSVSLTKSWNGKTLELSHSSSLSNDKTYTVTLSGYTAAGHDTMDNYSFSFTTEEAVEAHEFYGTLEPFAANAIYFVMTDRFVNGDTSNDQRNQGNGNWKTWDRPLSHGGNIGYQGGDFKGVHSQADFIKSMGFGAVWITPIIDNPNEAFSGGSDGYPSTGSDKGKTGYHGYWGHNFYQVDEHLPSTGYSFSEFTDKMHDSDLKVVLDIVCNHANPGFSMEQDQYNRSNFGKLFDENWNKVAESNNQQNGHDWFNGNDQLAQLLDFNPNNDGVFNYLTGAFLKWIGQGADAFRIDTIKHMPMSFWKRFSDKIRSEYPDFYMFGEAWNFDAGFLGSFTRPENGGINVLDFPGKAAMGGAFGGGSYSDLMGYLHLTDNVYENPYDLVTFYDNHDMARQGWSDEGFIDANNWLFTTRGIPCVYYGSEMGFMRGKEEHKGNRNYYGTNNINTAKNHRIYQELCKIGNIRKNSVALQKGLQVNINIGGSTATFMRVYQHNGENQTALVMLNKSGSSANVSVDKYITAGEWVDAETGSTVNMSGSYSASVAAHGFKVYLFNGVITNSDLISACNSGGGGGEGTGEMRIDPEVPTAGSQATIYYSASQGASVKLHWGKNFWGGDIGSDGGEFEGDVQMTWDSDEEAFKATITVPADAQQIDIGFLVNDGWVGGPQGNGWHVTCN